MPLENSSDIKVKLKPFYALNSLKLLTVLEGVWAIVKKNTKPNIVLELKSAQHLV